MSQHQQPASDVQGTSVSPTMFSRRFDIEVCTTPNQINNPHSTSDAELLLSALETYQGQQVDNYNDLLNQYAKEGKVSVGELLDSLRNGELAALVGNIKRLSEYAFLIGHLSAGDLHDLHRRDLGQ